MSDISPRSLDPVAVPDLVDYCPQLDNLQIEDLPSTIETLTQIYDSLTQLMQSGK